MTQRILITGSSGFTGRYMSRKLQDMGFEIWGLGKIKETSLAGVNMIEGDLTQPQSLSAAVESCQPHYVIHLAGVAFVGHNSPTAFYNVNLIGTHHLLQALSTHASRLKCVLLASSANVYGNTSGLLTEESRPMPVNDYAASKLAMEQMAHLWLPKLPIVIARPFNYTGVGQAQNFLIPKVISHASRGLQLEKSSMCVREM